MVNELASNLFAVVFFEVFLPLVLSQQKKIFLELVHWHEVQFIHCIIAASHQQHGKWSVDQRSWQPVITTAVTCSTAPHCTDAEM